MYEMFSVVIRDNVLKKKILIIRDNVLKKKILNIMASIVY